MTGYLADIANLKFTRTGSSFVSATVGGKAPSGLGSEALLDFHMEVTLDGEPLTETEIAELGIGRKFQKPTVFDMLGALTRSASARRKCRTRDR